MARTTFLAAILAGGPLGCSQPAATPTPSSRMADPPAKPTDRGADVNVEGPRGGRVKVNTDPDGGGAKVDIDRPARPTIR